MKYLFSALIVLITMSLHSQVLEIQTKGMLNCRSKELPLQLKTSTFTLVDKDSSLYSIKLLSKRDGKLTMVESFPTDGKTKVVDSWDFKKDKVFKIPYNFRKEFPKVYFIISDHYTADELPLNRWEITITQDTRYLETTIFAKIWATPVWGDYNCYPKK